MTSTVDITDLIRAEMLDADDLIEKIVAAHIDGRPCDDLVDDLRDTIDRIDALIEQLNGADE